MKAEIKRIDHLGIFAEVTKDLRFIELIDERIPDQAKEETTTGVLA